MKKILFLCLMFLGVNLSADIADCTNWYGNPNFQQPPKPYCWNFELTNYWTGDKNEIGQFIVAQEDVSKKNVTSFDYYALDRRGDGRKGFYVYISEWGYGSSTKPNLQMNYRTADLIGKSTFYNSSNIVLGFVYLFYVTQDNQDIEGSLKLYDYASPKDEIYIR